MKILFIKLIRVTNTSFMVELKKVNKLMFYNSCHCRHVLSIIVYRNTHRAGGVSKKAYIITSAFGNSKPLHLLSGAILSTDSLILYATKQYPSHDKHICSQLHLLSSAVLSTYSLICILCICYSYAGAVQVVPQGIESVNGSDINMGCASPLVNRSGVMVCDNSESYLVDGCSPDINTSTSNWASQLVTVRKNEANGVIHYDHVVLTFNFGTAVSPTSIELDLFLCPEWNIGAPGIYVYGYQNCTLVFNPDVGEYIGTTLPKSQSCDSLSTVHIGLGERIIPLSHSFHIVVDFTSEEIEWVHVGEVRFLLSTGPVQIQNCKMIFSGEVCITVCRNDVCLC